ncbi:MAG TPA: zinc ribbon domain-containing protein, partial [Nitrososphaerales archaeon]|nr:zinc ribbon domain-containing protein [Nitrososphaerales archaeon]
MTLNYCPNCGTPLTVGQNFCRSCGVDLRQLTQRAPVEAQQPTTQIRGLGPDAVVFLTSEGLSGTVFRSSSTTFLSAFIPLPLLVVAYLVIQEGAFAIYASAWIVLSLLIYDELRWRGFHRFEGNSSSGSQPGRSTWLVPWRSVRMADWNGRTLWFTSTNPLRKRSITFDHNDAPLVESSLASWGVRYEWKRPKLPHTLTSFPILVLILFVVGQFILILSAVLPFFHGEEQMYNTILGNAESQVAQDTFLEAFKAIVLNNLQVAWGGMLPVLGQLTFGLANYNTGRVIQVIAVSQNYPPSLVLISLYLLPHTWVEESAYPIATVAGLLAITRWRSVSPSEF